MNTVRRASDPAISATVMASAGTGKTWLLVTRAVRLLLQGAAPDAILAVTFTRKAAAEMAERLMQRLAQLASADDTGRRALLSSMGVEIDASTLRNAADLYERQLRRPRQIRFTTFHAFCQELLRRFPLEAEVPAGFEVVESPGLLQQEAWDALLAEATAAPGGATARALDTLFAQCNGLHNTRAALRQFLDHRSDWWAYSADQSAPLEWACQQLAKTLDIDPTIDPLAALFGGPHRQEFGECADLLARHGLDTSLKHAQSITGALHGEEADAARFTRLKTAFLTKEQQPLARKASKAMAKILGEAGQARLLELHTRCAERLLEVQDQLRRRNTLLLSEAWLHGGTRLLDHYQRIKTERRVLDFADLEWKAYRLMHHGDHALWVQYKLDQRIDHILVDEFQDTNPTQWHLLFPLLQELAAAEGERARSVFLVGDGKQSIYRFRRADPQLFPAAQTWLSEHLSADAHGLAASWRSAPVIIDFVNRLFESGPLHAALAEFPYHSTHRSELWGAVAVLPLVTSNDEDTAPPALTALRNPLLQPRVIREDRRYAREGALIAARIRRLIDDQTPVAHGGAARTLRYDDVMILVRQRTHLPAYGQALRDAGIPYLSANRGTLLQCVEIQDMKNLLTTLIVPYDNLALAAVLRSPLFACSDDDLIALAQYPTHTHWFERLLELGPRRATGTPLARAAMHLARWQQRAGQRPVHDLLDLIYSEGNVLARFDAAFPAHLKPRVRANLTRFLELALEVDSGRYPSLSAFLHRLRTVESDEDDAPDEAPVAAAEGGVRILTVHAAKGLEAPVVFLADAASVGRNNRAYQALVRWPTLAAAPSQFFLAGKGSELDRVSAALLDEQRREEAREQANLLYVALTRAQQYLFISGCEPQHRDERGWYGLIAAQLGDPGEIAAQGWHIEQGAAPAIAPLAQTLRATPPIDPRLAQPIRMPPRDIEIAPSRRDAGNATGDGDEDGRERGRAIHRFLELLCSEGRCAAAEAQRRVAYELGLDAIDARLAAWWQEAAAVYQEPALKMLFDDAYYDAAYNEVPMHYRQNDGVVYGVIDRLVISGDRCVVVDYKTHRGAADDPQRHAALFQEQLRLYAEGVALLWPDKKVEPYLLFTVNRRLYSL